MTWPTNQELGLPKNATSEQRVAAIKKLGGFQGLEVNTGHKRVQGNDLETPVAPISPSG